ncbi:MAG: DNA polymerase III subunit epsilon [Zetaproteobacteria bacterium CG_4_9_14_3_um_filter_49_83]|nr:MAG: DNA polymerase III subunit epsilon [Zetaproteobacteria bacterium CG1_02_49_23]PIQ30027.1 MAG: DNA polymerase III subunit epsilon [Zetaproteobacteria bacterium CG17_big_fil_post_rev_8_21_14_2_50_50_13]PIY56025.1 MAG: DNA polymerase III subunit epsilon [Zetaproteobacteria bacterium CG_4_10_14_0_8_um_filter_49_80]PJA36298.1 MAG: DNA polymerase III subunit epsilon [Zetaproteobacteria bacterium CG_4_9_14_3_um_filter_49_83]
MRLIMLDTETTGLSPFHGDRMVEIGAIVVSHRQIDTSSVFHHYIHPDRSIPQEVVRIHGIDDARVKGCPKFPEIAEAFLEFIQGGTLVIHNAAFDLGFIMNELALAGLPNIDHVPVIDTLQHARKKHPNQRNTLDALCDRYAIERGHRQLHGALLDSELLAEVYLAMTGGRQFSLDADMRVQSASEFVQIPKSQSLQLEKVETATLMKRAALSVNEKDRLAHQSMMERIGKESGQPPLWQ